jgi:hypothetical protein
MSINNNLNNLLLDGINHSRHIKTNPNNRMYENVCATSFIGCSKDNSISSIAVHSFKRVVPKLIKTCRRIAAYDLARQ